MSLDILRYKHYGCTMDGGYETPEVQDKFYWTFFEINNGKVISLDLTETFKNNKPIHSDLSCHYTECYKFGDDFYVWFNKTFSSKERNLGYPTKEEEAIVEKFFRKHIEKSRGIATEIIYL